MMLQAIHQPLWQQLELQAKKQQLPHAMLLVGPKHMVLTSFANYMVAYSLCQSDTKPCGTCRPCHLLTISNHPDVHYIVAETPNAAIKIEQIRDMQQMIYHAAQCGAGRFILIEPADRMNRAAANALLKVLEEPPPHVNFILVATQTSSIPATILSRCQRYFHTEAVTYDWRQMINYPKDSARGLLLEKYAVLIPALLACIEEKISPCALSAQWSDYAFEDIIWFLYLITAQVVYYQLTHIKVSAGDESLLGIAHLLKPYQVFQQLEQLNVIFQKINHNINMNQILVLENLLLGYLRSSGRGKLYE